MSMFDKMNVDCNRREFMRMSAGALGTLAIASSLPLSVSGKAPAIKAGKVTLTECLSMNPVAMAEKSTYVKSAYNYLLSTANEIQDEQLRRTTVEILKNPAARLMELYPSDSNKAAVKEKLVEKGYLKADAAYDEFLPPCKLSTQSVIPFYAAPGSGYGSHHSYPGGLPVHVGVNVKAALGFYSAYKDIFSFPMNRDIIIAAQTLHDLHKPWVFQWQENASSRKEYSIAGTGAHHVLTIAELIYRGMPVELVVAMACAHNHPGSENDERDVVNWIKAAALIAQKDPVKEGYLASTESTLPLPRRAEGFITHLGDHDWVFSVPEAGWMIKKLGEIAKQEYNMTDSDLQSKKFNTFRNYVFSQATLEQLYLIWSMEGETALLETIKNMVTI